LEERASPLTADNILEATLPELPEEEKETPAGFAKAGHLGLFPFSTSPTPYR